MGILRLKIMNDVFSKNMDEGVCERCSIGKGTHQLEFNGDWLCKECYDEVTKILKKRGIYK